MLKDLFVKSTGSGKIESSCTALLQHELRNKKLECSSDINLLFPSPTVTLDTEGVTRWNGGWGILLQVGPDAWLMRRRLMLCSSILMCLGMSWLLSSLVFGDCQNKLIVRLRRYAQPIRTWELCKWSGESLHFANNRLEWFRDSLLHIAALSSVPYAYCTWCVLLAAVYCNELQIYSLITMFCRSNFCYKFRPSSGRHWYKGIHSWCKEPSWVCVNQIKSRSKRG